MTTIISALPARTAVTYDKIFAIGDDGVKHEMSPIMIKIIQSLVGDLGFFRVGFFYPKAAARINCQLT
jgi:hypothetical protein